MDPRKEYIKAMFEKMNAYKDSKNNREVLPFNANEFPILNKPVALNKKFSSFIRAKLNEAMEQALLEFVNDNEKLELEDLYTGFRHLESYEWGLNSGMYDEVMRKVLPAEYYKNRVNCIFVRQNGNAYHIKSSIQEDESLKLEMFEGETKYLYPSEEKTENIESEDLNRIYKQLTIVTYADTSKFHVNRYATDIAGFVIKGPVVIFQCEETTDGKVYHNLKWNTLVEFRNEF